MTLKSFCLSSDIPNNLLKKVEKLFSEYSPPFIKNVFKKEKKKLSKFFSPTLSLNSFHLDFNSSSEKDSLFHTSKKSTFTKSEEVRPLPELLIDSNILKASAGSSISIKINRIFCFAASKIVLKPKFIISPSFSLFKKKFQP